MSVLAAVQVGSPPRVWGKHLVSRGVTLAVTGSPPRVWGKHYITARANCPITVHPHGCGENDTYFVPSAHVTSVHPHGCGENVSLGLLFLAGYRFTPTGVGKTAAAVCQGCPPAVHPHGCGENSQFPGLVPGNGTVHPHGCGENVGLQQQCAAHPLRFTPTGVGKTLLSSSQPRRTNGSPPRVWGKRAASRSTRAASPVHPHGCGENVIRCFQFPPITRFTPTGVGKTSHRAGRHQHRLRFTPTGVGKTQPSFFSSWAISGSPPRVWGKPLVADDPTLNTTGSPPRVWGKRPSVSTRSSTHVGSPPRVWGKPLTGTKYYLWGSVPPNAPYTAGQASCFRRR